MNLIPTRNLTDALSLSEPVFKTAKVMPGILAVPIDVIPVLEVYTTFEGEGTFIGTPRVLARVSGCGIGCTYCDTPHSWSVTGNKRSSVTLMRLDDFVAEIAEKAGSVREVSITGGEPLHYPQQLIYVANKLRHLGFRTSLETGGVIFNEVVFREFDHLSIDIKGPNSGVELTPDQIRLLIDWEYRHQGTQLKMVFSCLEDLEWLERNFYPILNPPDDRHIRPIVLTPVAGISSIDATVANNLVDLVINQWNKRYHIRVIAQMHKWLGAR